MSTSPFHSGQIYQDVEDVSSPKEQLPLRKILKQTAWTEEEGARSVVSRQEIATGSSNEVETSCVEGTSAVVESSSSRHRIRDKEPSSLVAAHQVCGADSQAAGSSLGGTPLRTISKLSIVDENMRSQSTPTHGSIKSGITGESPLRYSSQRHTKETLSVGSCRWSGEEESSPDRSRSITSQSDTRSYRDRLRERFHAVKEQVGSSLAETQPRSRVRRRRVVRSTTPHVDEQLKREEEEVVAALEKHERVRARWQDAALQVSSSEVPACYR